MLWFDALDPNNNGIFYVKNKEENTINKDSLIKQGGWNINICFY